MSPGLPRLPSPKLLGLLEVDSQGLDEPFSHLCGVHGLATTCWDRALKKLLNEVIAAEETSIDDHTSVTIT
eukprot:11985991-Heterocapsa_arctica.AAC.1